MVYVAGGLNVPDFTKYLGELVIIMSNIVAVLHVCHTSWFVDYLGQGTQTINKNGYHANAVVCGHLDRPQSPYR